MRTGSYAPPGCGGRSAMRPGDARSGERGGGEEGRYRGGPDYLKKKKRGGRVAHGRRGWRTEGGLVVGCEGVSQPQRGGGRVVGTHLAVGWRPPGAAVPVVRMPAAR